MLLNDSLKLLNDSLMLLNDSLMFLNDSLLLLNDLDRVMNGCGGDFSRGTGYAQVDGMYGRTLVVAQGRAVAQKRAGTRPRPYQLEKTPIN